MMPPADAGPVERPVRPGDRGETTTANHALAAAFGAADAAKEQDLRGYYPMAARVLADEVRRRKAGHDALKELTAKTGELIEHLQKTGRLAPCFNLPALDTARNVLEAPHG